MNGTMKKPFFHAALPLPVGNDTLGFSAIETHKTAFNIARSLIFHSGLLKWAQYRYLPSRPAGRLCISSVYVIERRQNFVHNLRLFR